jgi:hypothetical protein
MSFRTGARHARLEVENQQLVHNGARESVLAPAVMSDWSRVCPRQLAHPFLGNDKLMTSTRTRRRMGILL